MSTDPDASVDPDALADELSGIITALESTPDNVGLLRREIAIMRELEMMPEAIDTTLRLSALVMVEEYLWFLLFEELLEAPLTLESFVAIVEHFDTAEKDYFSMNLLERHARFLVESSKQGGTVDEAVSSFLTAETVRGMLASVYVQSAGDLGLSHRVWNVWRDWEMERLPHEADKAAHLERLHAMYLERLATPHLDSESTASSYSTFCTENDPNGYEERMVTATTTSQKAKAKLSGERRHGKTREDFEQQLLLAADNTMSQIPTLVAYMEWEMDPKAKSSGTSGPVLDQALIRSVSERTLAAYSQAGAEGADETRLQLKDGEAAIWQRYINWLRPTDNEAAADVALRATRACPQSPSLWSTLLLEMERQQCPDGDMAAAFERAQDLGAMFTESSTSFIDVFVTRITQQHRLLTAGDNSDLSAIIETAERGFALVERLNKAGDPSLKLEKYLLDWAETRAPAHLDEVLQLIEKPLRSRSASYQLIILKAGLECRRGNTTVARQIYANAIQRSDLDWPEAVFEAYLQFEDMHGTVDSILQTQSKVAKETQRLARRREKQQEQMAAEYTMPEVALAAAPAADPEVPVQVETVEAKDNSNNEVKRDREHTTVLIGGLAKGTPVALVESFFESCGRIRETTILSDDSRASDSALLEFQAVDAVSSALAKDRRKLDGQEISVTMLWRSTLFITNFPRELDDVGIRSLFGNYGHIIGQIRWPSRKYADNRRFCYITMDSPGAAESALVLDGYRSDPSSRFGLTVRISDPSAKVKRTDEKDSVLFVGGLGSKTTEQDVKDLFKEHKASIRSLKLGWDSAKGVCKGFAFVTLASEADAKEGLKLHGTSYHGKKLKVEQSDPNFNNKKAASDAEMKDKRSRTVRLNDVPAGMQEALLQQALEKIVPVRRLELFAKTNHAQAELENQADVGKLLLRTEPFIVEGSTITFADSGRRQAATPAEQKDSKASEVKGDALSFAPRAARRSGKTLGRGKHGASNAAPTPLPVTASGNAQDAFRAVVDAKNKQREGNLESTRGKRQLDRAADVGEGTGDDQEAKKPKTG